MATWSKQELQKIGETDDLHISSFREDGVTYGTPTWIWSVVLDGALYVRGYNGQKSRWYQAGLRQKARTHRRRWNDKGSHFRAGHRLHQRPHRRCVPREVSDE